MNAGRRSIPDRPPDSLSIARLADHFHVGGEAQDLAQPLATARIVVDQQDSNHRRTGAGLRVTSRLHSSFFIWKHYAANKGSVQSSQRAVSACPLVQPTSCRGARPCAPTARFGLDGPIPTV